MVKEKIAVHLQCLFFPLIFYKAFCVCHLKSGLTPTIQSCLSSIQRKAFENILVKGENAAYQHFLLFPKVFCKTYSTYMYEMYLLSCQQMLSISFCLLVLELNTVLQLRFSSWWSVHLHIIMFPGFLISKWKCLSFQVSAYFY